MIVFSSIYIIYLTSLTDIKNIKAIAKISNKEAYYCIERERFVASDDKSWIRWLVYYLLFPREQSLIPVERKYQFERKWLRFIIPNMNTIRWFDISFQGYELQKISNEFYIVSCRFAYVVCFRKHFIFKTSFLPLRDNLFVAIAFNK